MTDGDPGMCCETMIKKYLSRKKNVQKSLENWGLSTLEIAGNNSDKKRYKG